ncbi:efflux RND transporter periplasmic adaptor subunit [Shewanella hanedai]|uniref:Efflux RND transporter periplasmic adaptor subunit n=1 Tax=Shewanella hanedai TaxID=25 RepID=A0A553JNI7_SHEHA|nr:efflux RND transporter periplasmic adaptor subunit [Shewanella hanedai]
MKQLGGGFVSDKKHLLEKLKNDTSVNESGIRSKVIIFISLIIFFWLIYFCLFYINNGDIVFDGNSFEGNRSDVVSEKHPQIDEVTISSKISNNSSTGDHASKSELGSESHPLISASGDDEVVVLNASGYVVARRAATVSAELSGLLRQVLVEEGDRVSKGQVLAVLDRALAAADLDLVNSNMQVKRVAIPALKADIHESQREAARLKALRKSQFVSEELFTQAQTRLLKHENALLVANAEVERMKAEIQLKQLKYDKHSVRAPFDGVVIEKNAQMGEIVSPDSAGGGFTRTGICTLVDMASLEIEVEVNEAYIQKVFSGQKVNAILDAYKGENIPSYVEAIIPAADRAKGVFRVRIKITELNETILPGMGVTVSFLN